MKIELIIDNVVVGQAEMAKQSDINHDLYCIPHNNGKKIYYLQSLQIYPQYRMNGYSRRLINLIKQFADEKRCIICLDAIPLDKETSPSVLIKMYEDNGFRKCRCVAYTYGVVYEQDHN